jgi:hypothetical protein
MTDNFTPEQIQNLFMEVQSDWYNRTNDL